MSLTNYTDLLASVATWLNRTDLAANIPDFVTLCEAEMNRRLRTRDFETRFTAALVPGVQYLALPPNFGGFRRLEITSTTPTRQLIYMTPVELSDEYNMGVQNTPINYTISGNAIGFGPIPDSSYTIEADFYQVVTSLAANLTNWLMTSHPDAYLYGTLRHAAPFLGDDARIATWETLYERAMEQIKDQDLRDRWSGAPIVMKSGTWTP